MKTCSETMLNDTYPGITFSSDGVSNLYSDYITVTKPKHEALLSDFSGLERYVERIKREGSGKEFDCILGLSGGLDSSFMLHLVVTEFELRPLVFHVDAGWNSEVATHNIKKMVDGLGVELFTEVVNWNEMRQFQLAYLKSGLPNIDTPQDHAFSAVLGNFAQKYRIKTILNGGNIATEGFPMPYLLYFWQTDKKQISDVVNRFGSGKLSAFPLTSAFKNKFLLPYVHGVRVFKPLNYIEYGKQSAEDLLTQRYSWRAYGQKHFESVFTRFYEGWWLPSRWNFDVRQCQLSSRILSGEICRDEALRVMNKPSLTDDEVDRELGYISDKLGISLDELMECHRLPKRYHWDYRNSAKLFELGSRFLQSMRVTTRGGAY